MSQHNVTHCFNSILETPLDILVTQYLSITKQPGSDTKAASVGNISPRSLIPLPKTRTGVSLHHKILM